MIIASFAFINFVVCCSVFTLHASFLQSLVIFSLVACLAVVATCKNTDGVKLAIDSCVLERFLCRRHSAARDDFEFSSRFIAYAWRRPYPGPRELELTVTKALVASRNRPRAEIRLVGTFGTHAEGTEETVLSPRGLSEAVDASVYQTCRH